MNILGYFPFRLNIKFLLYFCEPKLFIMWVSSDVVEHGRRGHSPAPAPSESSSCFHPSRQPELPIISVSAIAVGTM